MSDILRAINILRNKICLLEREADEAMEAAASRTHSYRVAEMNVRRAVVCEEKAEMLRALVRMIEELK